MECHGIYRVILLLLGFCCSALGQDESLWRKLFNGELKEKEEVFDLGPEKFILSSPKYQFDLNGDGHMETIKVIKKDTRDLIQIFDFYGKLVFEYKFVANGWDSRLYKVGVSRLKEGLRVLIFYYFEGVTEASELEATGRLYFLPIEESKWKNFAMVKGPSYWIEKGKFRDQYYRRQYRLSVVDVDQDGTRDLVLHQKDITKIWKYLGQGEWANW